MKYNGHKNWNHWNVSLWINNDEGLYNLVQSYLRSTWTKDKAAQYVFDEYFKGKETPDGAPYSVSAIRAAMVGM